MPPATPPPCSNRDNTVVTSGGPPPAAASAGKACGCCSCAAKNSSRISDIFAGSFLISFNCAAAPKSPWQNAYVERLIGTLRRDLLDHVIVLDEHHLKRMVDEYLTYYHDSRTHLGLGKECPTSRPVQSGPGEIIGSPRVGGLHHRYDRSAA